MSKNNPLSTYIRHFFFYTQSRALRPTGSVAMTQAQCELRKLSATPRSRTLDQSTLWSSLPVQNSNPPIHTFGISSFIRSYALCPHMVQSLLRALNATCARYLQCRTRGQASSWSSLLAKNGKRPNSTIGISSFIPSHMPHPHLAHSLLRSCRQKAPKLFVTPKG